MPIPMRRWAMPRRTTHAPSRFRYRVHTLLCRGTGLPPLFLLSPANVHDAPFARPLLAWAVRLFQVRPRVVRLDAGYWGLKLIAWIHTALGAYAVLPWNPKRQKRRDGLPATWTAKELGKRTVHPSLLRAYLHLLSFATPSGLWMVSGRHAGCLDLRRALGDCLGCLSGGPPRVDSFSPPRAGSCLGGPGRLKRPQVIV